MSRTSKWGGGGEPATDSSREEYGGSVTGDDTKLQTLSRQRDTYNHHPTPTRHPAGTSPYRKTRGNDKTGRVPVKSPTGMRAMMRGDASYLPQCPVTLDVVLTEASHATGGYETAANRRPGW